MPALTKGKLISNRRRIKPMSILSESAAIVFTHVVASVDPDHFSEVDLPLLESYANAAALQSDAARHIEHDGAVIDGKASPWLAVQEKAVKALTALSARLRIAPQSRFDRLVAGANSRPQPDMRRLHASSDDDLLAKTEDRFFGGTK